jgi:hypothetical protein
MGLVTDTTFDMFQGAERKQFPASKVSTQCQIILPVEIRLRNVKTLGNEEGKCI